MCVLSRTLLLHQGPEAAIEFQKILDHRNIAMNSPVAGLARLGLARAYALQGHNANARSMYHDFFTVWKGLAALTGFHAFERACCTISTKTFLVSARLLTSRKNAMRTPRMPSWVFKRA
jgi:hypothetical protein